MARVGLLGGGSWGTALAKLLAENGNHVDMWVFEPELVDLIQRTRINSMYLPNVELPTSISPTNDIEKVVSNKEFIVCVVPSHVLRLVVGQAAPYIPVGVPIISASKGIENDTLMTMSEVFEDILPIHCHPYLAFLSGPSFAAEVSKQMPTAVTIAAYSEKLAKMAQELFSNHYFRAYTSKDVVGVELGGALKNVIAIAAGGVEGMELGTNARAGLITRGLGEMTKIAVRKGANPLTLAGLSGMGDLVLTCTGPLSRNRTVGFKLGTGQTIHEILAEMKMVAEGVKTARSVHDLAHADQLDLPICEQVYQVLYHDKPVKQTLLDLMARDLKREYDGW